MQILIQRIYDPPLAGRGRRILVDRLWPRGVSKQKAQIDYWARTAAPSDALRRWYRHDPDKWQEFCRRYFTELDANPEAVAELESALGNGLVTLVYSSREEVLNNAAALRDYLLRRAASHESSD